MTRTSPIVRRFHTLAEIALVAVTASVAVGLGRLLADASFLGPVLIVAVVAHAGAWIGRRLGWGAAAGTLLTLLVGALTIVLLRYGPETWYGLPSAPVLDALGDDLREGWRVFQEEGAPAPVVDGFVVAAMAAVTAVAALSDGLAFRVGTALEALAPAAGLFLFTTVLAGPDHQVTATVLFMTAALGFLLADRVARRAPAAGWLGAARGRGPAALLRSGAWFIAVAALGGLAATIALPGADAAPIIDLEGDGDGTVTISPLVEIQNRLVEQSATEVFTVRSNERAYWRLTALDRFDGSVWSASGEFVPVAGSLPAPDDGRAGGGRRVRQRVRLEALGDVWLPAAYEATAVRADGVDVEWDPASSSLIAPERSPDAGPLSYEVTSVAPLVDPDGARAAGPGGPALDPLRQLPPGFSAEAARLARRVTRAAERPYDKARALQDFFRDEFTYSLDVPAGHGVADIDDFLAVRVGYCEQFSGAYAAMARAVGLPSRVAVGFTPGEEDPEEPGLYHVRGEHAHAWPEVYLDGLGWVAFEPTPGRGAPGAEPYTGVAEQQVGETAPGIPGPTTTTGPPTPTPSVDTGDPTPTSVPAAGTPGSPPGPAGGRAGGWTVAVLVLAVGGLAWVLGAPTVVALRRAAARRRAGGEPGPTVALAWDQVGDALERAGLRRRPAETPASFGQRAADALAPRSSPSAAVRGGSGSGQALADVTRAVTVLWYGGAERVDAALAQSARRGAAAVTAASRARTGRGRWWLSGLDPRRMAKRRPTTGRRRMTGGV